MQYRRLGHSELLVSEIAVGSMMFGDKTAEPEAIRIVHRALDAGVNLIDTADVYAGGESERILGRALKGRRSQAVIATKGGHARSGRGLGRRDLFLSVEDSLRRLDTDCIDLYQVHRFDPDTPVEETLLALHDLVRAGSVRYVGCSNWAASQLREALRLSSLHGWIRFDSVQPRYNLIEREPERELFPLCMAEGVGVLAYGPQASGVLTGKYLDGVPAGSRGAGRSDWQQAFLTPENQAAAQRVRDVATRLGRPAGQVALRWCLANPAVSSVLVGVSTEAQWAEALPAGDWTLSQGDLESLTPAR